MCITSHRVLALAHVQARQRAPGAADGVESPASEIVEQLRLLQRVARDLGRLLRRAIGKLEQRQAAERQGDAAPDLAAGDVGKLERAAAEVADHAVGGPDRRRHAQAGELRFARAGEQVDLATDRPLRQLEELWTVGGVAHRRRRQRAQVGDAHRPAQDAEALQRPQRLGRRVLGKKAGRRDAATEPAQHLLVEDRGERAAQRFIGDEADRIRPDVDDRHGFARQPPSCFQPRHSILPAARPVAGRSQPAWAPLRFNRATCDSGALGRDSASDLPRPDRLGLVMKYL